MALDLKSVKEKLEALNNKGTKKKSFEKIDYEKFFFKPKPGKYVIRFVPSRLDKTNPFKEVYFHYGIKNYPVVALTNYGEKDPIVEFCASLRKSSEKENWSLAKKLDPKMRIFAPVIVRGEEEKGVRLWEFGTIVYKQLLGLADDEDYGDFTDIAEGRDFTLDATMGETAGRPSVNCALRIKPKTSPLSATSSDVELWLNEQPNILELRKHHTFEEIKTMLSEFLNPDDKPVSAPSKPAAKPLADDADSDLPFDAPTVPSKSKPVTKASTADKFNEMFND